MFFEITGSIFAVLGAFLLSRNLKENPKAIFYAFISFFISNIFMLHLALIEGMTPLLIQQALFMSGAVVGLISHAENKEKVKTILLFFVILTTLSMSYLYFFSGKDFIFEITLIEVLAAFFAITGNFVMKTHNPETRLYAFYLFVLADILYIGIGLNAELYFFAFQATFFIYTSYAGIMNTRKLINNPVVA